MLDYNENIVEKKNFSGMSNLELEKMKVVQTKNEKTKFVGDISYENDSEIITKKKEEVKNTQEDRKSVV
jgi:hypothetical protein